VLVGGGWPRRGVPAGQLGGIEVYWAEIWVGDAEHEGVSGWYGHVLESRRSGDSQEIGATVAVADDDRGA
jgi:hypothetical protein